MVSVWIYIQTPERAIFVECSDVYNRHSIFFKDQIWTVVSVKFVNLLNKRKLASILYTNPPNLPFPVYRIEANLILFKEYGILQEINFNPQQTDL